MKKIFTFFAALMMTNMTFAQMHGGMYFVGDADFSVTAASGEQKKRYPFGGVGKLPGGNLRQDHHS